MSTRPSILIAESKQFLVDVIREAFRQEDYGCICVQTEKEVFEMMGKADAAVVGLDVCSGDQERRIDMVRSLRESFDTPLMALTSVQYSSVRIALLKSGADDVMTKPFNPDELVVRVGKLLARHK